MHPQNGVRNDTIVVRRAMGSSAAERGLPFLSDLIYIQIARHLQCRELGRLARASSRFGLVRPIQAERHTAYTAEQLSAGDTEQWTIVEEGARQRVQNSGMCGCVPRRGAESWMRLLGELERLQRPIFTATGPDVVLRDSGRTAVRLSGGMTPAQQFYLQSAVCAGVNLRAGSHFIEFVWVAGRSPQRNVTSVSSEHVAETLGLLEDEDEEDDPFLAGVCSPNFDPTDGSMASNDTAATLFSART